MAIFFQKFQLLTLITGTCFVHGSLAQQQRNIDPSIQTKIDDFVNNVFLPYSKVSSLGLTVVKNNGEILYTTGYGFADHQKGILNGNNTQFLLGSITKSFTSIVAVKVLHERFPEMGESVLDTPIRKLIASAKFTLIDRFRSEYTTFRDLLSHRTCISRDDLQLVADPFPTTSEIVYRERYAEEMCGVRSEFQYNNQMYVIAGELIGMIANKSYTELINNLLEDIGMHNSTLLSEFDDFSNMPFRGQPYYVMDNVSHPINPDLIKRVVVNKAAGGLYSTPDNMALYMRFILNKGSVDGRQIIPQGVMAWMTKPGSIFPAVPFKQSEKDILIQTFGYGLGLMLAVYDGREFNHHGGYFPPYTSFMSLFPSQNLGIFTSTNEGPVKVDATFLHTFVIEIFRGTANTTEVALTELLKTKAIKDTTERGKKQVLEEFLENSTNMRYTQTNDDIVGKYGSGVSGDVKILEKFNSQTNATELFVQYGKWYHGWLLNIGQNIYQINWTTDVIQDNYAQGDKSGLGYLRVQNETLEFIAPGPTGMVTLGKFKLGVGLDILPIIPWAPDSCGPEVNTGINIYKLNEIS